MESVIFNELDIKKELKKAIADMGFVEATPVQSQSIGPMMEGRDIVAQAPTGTGKTCAFGIPLINGMDNTSKDILALILCPTRELVVQNTNELMKLTKYMKSIRIVPVYGGQNMERQIMALKRKPQIIVATPGRLMDHMRRKTIRLDRLQYLVLDEADEMLDMGFKEDIDTILENVHSRTGLEDKEQVEGQTGDGQTAKPTRQTVLFSATMSPKIRAITKQYLTDPVKVQITKSEITVPNTKQYYLEVSSENKTDVLARLIDVSDFKLTMVFCNTKRKVDELSHEMAARGYNAQGLHGDMRQMQRDHVIAEFKKGKVEILIATDVAARGLDINGVEAVFNYDLPDDLEYYVHRIGRTGRANKDGISYSFVGRREMYKLREIMNYTKAKIRFMQIPKVEEITDVRSKQAMTEIFDLVGKTDLSGYEEIIEKFMEESDSDDMTIMDIAAAFLCKEVKTEGLSEIEVKKPSYQNRNYYGKDQNHGNNYRGRSNNNQRSNNSNRRGSNRSGGNTSRDKKSK